MPTNQRQFAIEMDAFGKLLLPAEFRIFQKRLAIELLSRVVKKTPVDTGRARGNWQLGIDVVPLEVLEDVDKSGGSTITKGLSALKDLRGPGFQTIFLSNNLAYIEALEEGHSQNQAPQGMLAVSIAELSESFK